MSNSDLPAQQIHPILILGETHFARLLVLQAHLDTKHGGKRDTLIQLRSRYWITKARKLVHDVIRKCARCNRLEAKAFQSREAAPLPEFRVKCSFPFENVGVDYLGPVLVRQVFDGRDRTVYVCGDQSRTPRYSTKFKCICFHT